MESRDMNTIIEFINKHSQEANLSSSQEISCLEMATKHCTEFKQQYDVTLDVGSKEASGYVLLGYFFSIIRDLIADKYPAMNVAVDHQFPVCASAADEALIALIKLGSGLGVFITQLLKFCLA